MSIRSAAPALAAALLFGASTPFAKLLVGNVAPLLLAGLLYLGSGLGLCLLLALRQLRQKDGEHTPNALRIPRAELPGCWAPSCLAAYSAQRC